MTQEMTLIMYLFPFMFLLTSAFFCFLTNICKMFKLHYKRKAKRFPCSLNARTLPLDGRFQFLSNEWERPTRYSKNLPYSQCCSLTSRSWRIGCKKLHLLNVRLYPQVESPIKFNGSHTSSKYNIFFLIFTMHIIY